MKNIYIILIALMGLVPMSCNLDLENPNAATDEVVLNTKDGLFALAIGIQSTYSTSALESVILTPSVTTRETAIMTTFANLEELEEGGSKLSGENGYTSRLFSRLMRTKGMTEDLIKSIDNISVDAGTASGLRAWGSIFRALCLEGLANNFTHVALTNSLDNNASFSPREDAYTEAIKILSNAIDGLKANPVSTEFTSSVSSSIDVLNTCQALLARYQLIAGDYNGAIASASSVDPSSVSVFNYDDMSQNGIYANMYTGTISYAPRTRFGLPSSFEIDPEDARTAFFVAPDTIVSLNNLEIGKLVAPFFGGLTTSIPVYRPGEMDLIIAESHARTDNLSAAEDALNALRNRTAEESPIGLGAGLTSTYTADGNKAALLDEIYKNRRMELFLTGMSLEDSRRFERPTPPTGTDFTTERNRNFYPFPLSERQNNPNTPADPQI